MDADLASEKYWDAYIQDIDTSFGYIESYKKISKYKTRIFKKNETKTILFNGINVIPYPGTEDMYKVTFSEIYKSSSFSFLGDKVLIVKLQDSKIKIITEK